MGQLPFEKIPRIILKRQDAKTSPKFGCEPSKRPIKQLFDFGVVNIDKPSGPTSHQVSAYVKKILNISKSGHSGTLDPKVTGVLPIAVGRGTRVVQSLLTAGKEYVCVMHIHADFDEAQLRQIIKDQFTGKIKQLPPVKSAIKRQWRFRKIYYFEILEIKEHDVLFRVGTQAGTYIRKLCHDIGVALGCGAHMAQLRRSKVGPFTEESTLCSLQDLTDAMYYHTEKNDDTKLRKYLQPVEAAVNHLPSIWVTDSTVNTLCQGATLKVPGISKVESEIQVGEPVAVLTLKGELVCVGACLMTSSDLVSKQNGVAVKSSQVFMPPTTYPKIPKD